MHEDLLVKKARLFAEAAHAGQFRRDGVTPYIKHPERVVEILKMGPHHPNYGVPDALAVGWLHDTIEDSKGTITIDTLRRDGFDDEIVLSVAWLTKHPGLPYESYLSGAKDNHMARVVKIADMLANLTDSPSPKQVERYIKGIMYLST